MVKITGQTKIQEDAGSSLAPGDCTELVTGFVMFPDVAEYARQQLDDTLWENEKEALLIMR